MRLYAGSPNTIYEDGSNEIHIIWTYFARSRHLPCGMQMTSTPKKLSSAPPQQNSFTLLTPQLIYSLCKLCRYVHPFRIIVQCWFLHGISTLSSSEMQIFAHCGKRVPVYSNGATTAAKDTIQKTWAPFSHIWPNTEVEMLIEDVS